MAVDDKVSGLAGGEIEISREGTGSWQVLSTSKHGSRLLARVDDALLAPGTYLLRATARDNAANQNSTDRCWTVAPGDQPAASGRSRMRAGVVPTHRAAQIRPTRQGRTVRRWYPSQRQRTSAVASTREWRAAQTLAAIPLAVRDTGLSRVRREQERR